ncbi:MAG TPA: alpha/beta hydrolase [Mobilitalea sp.]|nr:alpha/beta hydrolase [Mobilitalea sp.]
MIEQLFSLKDGKRVFMRYYNDLPNAKTILYLHGGPGDNCENFNCAAHNLSNNFNIVMIDQRGVLRSDRVEENEPLSVPILIDDCEYIRTQLQIEKWILIGHSYGGFLSLLYSYLYPASVDKVIYENPSWSSLDAIKTIHRNTSEYLRTIKEFELADKIDMTVATCDDFEKLIQLQLETPEKYRERVYYNKAWTTEIIKYCSLQNITSDQWENSNIHHKRIINDKINYEYTLPYLKKIVCPSMLIRGDHDPVMSKEFQEYFIANSPDGELIVIPDCGHYVHTDDVVAFCKSIVDFCMTE